MGVYWDELALRPFWSLTAVCASMVYLGYRRYQRILDDSSFPRQLLNNEWAQKSMRSRHYFNVIIMPLLNIKWRLENLIMRNSTKPMSDRYIQCRRKMFSSICDDQDIQEGVRVEVEVVGDVKCYIFTPLKSVSGEALKPNCIFWYHGGGQCICTVGGTYFQLLQSLCKLFHMTIISPEYRLAPENKSPAGFNDCYSATETLLKRYKMKDYILAGDSAGGQLCTAVAIKLAVTHGSDDDFGRPSVLAPVYPHYQPSMTTKSMLEEDLPTLSRDAIARYLALASCGTFSSDLVDDILADRHLSLVGDQNLVKYCRFKDDDSAPVKAGPMKCKNRQLISSLQAGLNNVNLWPLTNSDADLRKLLEFCTGGIYMLVCDHDTIRDDGMIFMERLVGLNSDIGCNLKSWNVMYGYHAIFSTGKYALPKIHTSRTENDDVVDLWYENIREML